MLANNEILKKFREEHNGKELSNEISAAVDSWVSDLIRSLVSEPMNPDLKRGLWDRFKGSVSNIWHGGRTNTNNPYYWKNRFGDELGAQESFNPSFLNLKEYYEIRSIVKKIEEQLNQINEDVPQGAEKLRIVQLIKSSAEKLKMNLYDIITSKDVDDIGPSVEQPPTQNKTRFATVSRKAKQPASEKSIKTEPEQNAPEEPTKTVPEENAKPTVEERFIEKYNANKPKEENKDKTTKELVQSRQLIDAINSDGFNLRNTYIPDNDKDKEFKLISHLERMLAYAKSIDEDKKLIGKIKKAIEIVKNQTEM